MNYLLDFLARQKERQTPKSSFWDKPVMGNMPLSTFVQLAGMGASAFAPNEPSGRFGNALASMAYQGEKRRNELEDKGTERITSLEDYFLKEGIKKEGQKEIASERLSGQKELEGMRQSGTRKLEEYRQGEMNKRAEMNKTSSAKPTYKVFNNKLIAIQDGKATTVLKGDDYQMALSSAMKDPQWQWADEMEQAELIQKHMRFRTGKSQAPKETMNDDAIADILRQNQYEATPENIQIFRKNNGL